jgi:MoaA/NifB/PqqE/SkfB family radical SAM enzyme
MSFEKVKKFLEDNRKNFSTILFTGGEPFLREDIYDIIDVAKANRLSCGVCTNGTLLDPEKTERIKKLDFIIFSIHGPKDIHDEITGKRGNFDATLGNIERFLSVNPGTKTMINCSITEKNFDRLDGLVNIAERFRVPLRYEHLNYMNPDNISACGEEWKARMKDMPACKVVTYSALPDIGPSGVDRIYKSMRRILADHRTVSFKPNLDRADLEKWYSDRDIGRACHYAWNSLQITPAGDVLPCHFLDVRMGNINETPLLEIWNSDRYKKFRRELKKGIFIGCRHCCKL